MIKYTRLSYRFRIHPNLTAAKIYDDILKATDHMHISSYLNNRERERKKDGGKESFIYFPFFCSALFLDNAWPWRPQSCRQRISRTFQKYPTQYTPAVLGLNRTLCFSSNNLTLKIKADINSFAFFFFFCSHSKFFSLPVLDLHFPWSVVSCQTSAVSSQVTPWLTGNYVEILISRSSATFSFVA